MGARRTLAFTCCAAMFVYAAYLGAIGVLLPAVGKTFGLGSAAQGRLFPANFLGFILIVLVAAPLSDRWNRKTVLMLGQAMFALGLIVFSRASSFEIALAASLLIGGGSGAVGVTSSALASDLYPLRRGAMLAAIQVAFGLGAALGPGLGSVLLQHQVSWRLLYAGTAFAAFALLVALQAQELPGEEEKKRRREEKETVGQETGNREQGTEEKTEDRRQKTEDNALSTINYQLSTPDSSLITHHSSLSSPSTMLSLLTQRPVQLLCLMQICYAGAEVGYFSWMPTYFQTRLPGGATLSGAVISVFWLAMTVGRSLTGKFMGKTGFMPLCAKLAAAGAIAASLTLLWHNPYVVLGFVIVTGLCFAGIFILMSAEASERYVHSLGAIFGCIVACGGLGTSLIPWAVGAVASTSAGWSGGLMLVPLAALGVALCAVLLARQKH